MIEVDLTTTETEYPKNCDCALCGKPGTEVTLLPVLFYEKHPKQTLKEICVDCIELYDMVLTSNHTWDVLENAYQNNH